jgi:hypothetical protein
MPGLVNKIIELVDNNKLELAVQGLAIGSILLDAGLTRDIILNKGHGDLMIELSKDVRNNFYSYGVDLTLIGRSLGYIALLGAASFIPKYEDNHLYIRISAMMIKYGVPIYFAANHLKEMPRMLEWYFPILSHYPF